MKKARLIKIITLIVAFSIIGLFLFGSTKSMAELNPDDLASQTSYGGDIKIRDKHEIIKFSTRIYQLGYGIAIVVSVVAIMYLGLKYITGGLTEKAEYKKNIIPICIGIGIIVFLSTIISIAVRFGESI